VNPKNYSALNYSAYILCLVAVLCLLTRAGVWE